jgi:hypothetical protein
MEGLWLYESPQLALCWVGHNGERLADAGPNVVFVNCRCEYIPGSAWPAFLEEQEQLPAARNRGMNLK